MTSVTKTVLFIGLITPLAYEGRTFLFLKFQYVLMQYLCQQLYATLEKGRNCEKGFLGNLFLMLNFSSIGMTSLMKCKFICPKG